MRNRVALSPISWHRPGVLSHPRRGPSTDCAGRCKTRIGVRSEAHTTIDLGPDRTCPSNPFRMSVTRRPDRSVWLDRLQTRPTPAPANSPGARTYWYQNRDVLRSGARPAAPQTAHNSVRAASAIPWRPTPPAPTGRPKKLVYAFSSNAAFSDADPAC
jgi:hypothetical protein